jgi:hypothetical protein
MSEESGKVNLNLNIQVKLTSKSGYDKNVYDASSYDKAGYNKYIQDEDENGIELEEQPIARPSKRNDRDRAQKDIIEDEQKMGHHDEELFRRTKERTIVNRQDEYQQRKRQRASSPERHDPLKDIDGIPEPNARTYQQVMMERIRENKQQEMLRKQAPERNVDNSAPIGVKKQKIDDNTSVRTKLTTEWDKLDDNTSGTSQSSNVDLSATPRRKRWDLTPNEATPRGNYYI